MYDNSYLVVWGLTLSFIRLMHISCFLILSHRILFVQIDTFALSFWEMYDTKHYISMGIFININFLPKKVLLNRNTNQSLTQMLMLILTLILTLKLTWVDVIIILHFGCSYMEKEPEQNLVCSLRLIWKIKFTNLKYWSILVSLVV